MEIRVDDLKGAEIAALLEEHLRSLRLHTPPESVHALDLDSRHGEVKSMRTDPAHLRKGVARTLLLHIVEEARRRSYRRLSLETGSGAPFEPAHALYLAFGFKPCGPFADYIYDPFSVFMTREI